MGNTLVVLSLLSLVFATTYPRVRRLAIERDADAVAADVRVLSDAARERLTREGSWPSDSSTGTIPAELAGALPADFSFAREGLTMTWNVWQTVRAPQATQPDDAEGPPRAAEAEPIEGRALNLSLTATPDVRPTPTLHALATVTLHTDDALLLAMLLERFGPTRSFVRGGSWTLIVPEAG